MKNSWHLGRYAGIDVRIHWTFLLIPLWIYFSTMAAGSGAIAASVAVLFVLAIFGCVVLHEYGHSLTARRFGIATRDITLLPIGGLASLQRMPRNPWQELAIAVAGPAVNVVIAASLFFALPILAAVLPIVVVSFLAKLAWVNIALVIFNMIPAFPMDGGRVLRAVLALSLPYASATRVAVGVGRFAAMGLGLVGLLTGNLMLILIAAFVFIAGGAELATAKLPETSARKTIPTRSVLLDAAGNEIAEIPPQSLPVVSGQWHAQNVLGWLSSDTVDEFIVSSHGVAVAIVRKCDLRQAVRGGMGSIPMERLLAGHFVPFRDVPSCTAA